MLDRIRPLLSRVLAPLILLVAVKLFDAIGVPMPEDLPELISEIVLALITYALVHRGIDRVVNPGDAASSRIAVQEVAEKAQIKAYEKRETI